jgi:hypothetical protein
VKGAVLDSASSEGQGDRHFCGRYIGCAGHPGRLSGLGLSHSKPVLYGAFVWMRRALDDQKWQSPARADALGSAAASLMARVLLDGGGLDYASRHSGVRPLLPPRAGLLLVTRGVPGVPPDPLAPQRGPPWTLPR